MNAGPAPHDQLSDYLARIRDVALLTAGEEVELARRMEAGTYAAHLIEQGAAEPELEMVATWWIRKAIQRGLEHAHTIRLPIGVQDQLTRVARAEADATHRLGRRPTDRELAEEAGQEPAKVTALRRLPRGCVSLDAPAGEGRRPALGEIVEDRQPPPERLVEDAELKALLASLVAGLAPRQVLIMRLRFGLDGRGERTPRQIADRFGLTPHWVRQLEKESLALMRGRGSGLRAWAG